MSAVTLFGPWSKSKKFEEEQAEISRSEDLNRTTEYIASLTENVTELTKDYETLEKEIESLKKDFMLAQSQVAHFFFLHYKWKSTYNTYYFSESDGYINIMNITKGYEGKKCQVVLILNEIGVKQIAYFDESVCRKSNMDETNQNKSATFRCNGNYMNFTYEIQNDDGKRTTYIQAYTDREKVIFKDDIIAGVYVKMID